jgi:DNA polymerase III alpha subunit
MRIRSEYSSRFTYGKLQDVHNRVLQLDWPKAPISDRLSTYGFASWQELCDEVKVKPVFGVEIGVSAQLGQKKPAISYWTFFAIKKLRSINELVFKATSKSGHYHALSYEEALDAPDTIKIADHKVSLGDCDLKETFYIALGPSIPIGLFREAKEKGFQFIATSDNVFTYAEDKLVYHTLFYKDAETAPYPQHILTDDEWRASLPYCVTNEDAELAIINRNIVMAMCNAKLLKADVFRPDDIYSLKQMCLAGAKNLNIDLNDPIYAERLERELKLIYEKDFNDYFYIVADLVNFAKRNMIVGPARGSAAGSLVSYLTGITTVDPIKFKLLFERFIDVSRADLPDIDLDFSDTKRHLVFEYLKEKYGASHVAHLGTTMKFKAKSIMNRAGMSLGIPRWLSDQVSETLIERSSADSRAMQTFEETFSATDIGRKLLEEYPEISTVFDVEDHISHYGTHAAGVAITSGDVLDYVAIDGRNGTIMADKTDAEKFNILKIDILGVSQLSIFERCLELIGEAPRNGFLERLPLDDQAAFDVLNKKQFSGIFQANGKSLQILFQMIHTDRIDDLVAITALSRPGPVGTGGAVRWARRRAEGEAITYRHPLLEPYLKDTFGEVVYQEQVMQICRDIGRMGFAEVSKVRKAMSKSMGAEEIKSYGKNFIEGALLSGIPADIVETVWGELVRFGAYGFNLSHAVSYGLITYYCCWLKAHYPMEFAAATLDSEYDSMKQLFLLRELDREGIKYQPIDPNHSTDKWTIKSVNGGRILVGPLTNIHGVGPITVRKILESRLPGGKPLTPAIQAKISNAATKIDSLTPISDAIKKIDLKALGIISEPIPIAELHPGVYGEVNVFALAKRIQPRDLNDLQSVNKRGYRLNGQSWVMRLFVFDDTDEILCQIDRDDFLTKGKEVEQRGGQGDALYAIKGYVPSTFRMIKVTRIRFMGLLSDTQKPKISNDLFPEGVIKGRDLFA